MDGSNSENHVGCGFVIYRGYKEISADSKRLPKYCKVYQLEVMAIHLAAQEAAHVLDDKDTYIKLFSDSQAALKSLNKYHFISKVVGEAV